MTLEEIKQKLSDRNLSEIARRIGVTRAYLSAIKTGVIVKLSDSMNEKLTNYFEAN